MSRAPIPLIPAGLYPRRDDSNPDYMRDMKKPTGLLRYRKVSHQWFNHTYEVLPEGLAEIAFTVTITEAGTHAGAGNVQVSELHPTISHLVAAQRSDGPGVYVTRAVSEIVRLKYPDEGEHRWY